MPEHLAESQPRHADPGMDALIRHLDSTPDAANATGGEQPPAPADPEPPEPIAAEATEAPEEDPPADDQAAELVEGEGYDEDPLITVKVGGVEEQVPLSELASGYQRNADYTRKTQAVAEERRKLEAERSQLMLAQREAVERAAGLADQLAAQINASRTDPKELERLRVSDPAEYAARVADEQRRQQLIADAQQQLAYYESQQRAAQIAEARQALAEASPDFANDFEGTYQALGRWITSPDGGGISVEDWNRETDPRRILLAFHAWKGREQSAAATERTSSVRAKVAQLPRIRSGARHEPGQTEQANYTAAVERMSRTNSTRDIAAALQARSGLANARRDGNGPP